MAKKLFLDTDIVIDYLTDRKPFSYNASFLFDLHYKNKIKINISAISINNIYYISRKILDEKKTLNLLEKLVDDLEIISTSKTEIKNAFQVNFKDFEDGMQYTTACTIKNLDAIITRNIKDFKNVKIAIFTPESFLKLNNFDN